MPGFTCCVPHCFNNNKRERHLKYYEFPKNPIKRQLWIKNIGRAGNSGKYSKFKPTTGHRVCSEHFEGGKKTYMINAPTIFKHKPLKTTTPRRQIVKKSMTLKETILPIGIDQELQFGDDSELLEVDHVSQVISNVNNDHSSYSLRADDQPSDLLRLVKDQQETMHCMKNKIHQLELKLLETKKELKQCQDGLKHSKETASINQCWKRKYSMMCMNLERTKKELSGKTFSMKSLKLKAGLVKFYTGFATYTEFKNFHDFLFPDLPYLQYWGSKTLNAERRNGRFNRVLTSEDELLLFLCRLRVGLLEEDLASRFGISQSTVSRICKTYIELLYVRFRQVPIWPSRKQVDLFMPDCFKEHYSSTRVIIDCTELFIETPSHYTIQSETYSTYKNHNTAKGLVGIAPNGYISFISDLVPGRMSDKEVTANSGLIDCLEEGDSVMADRGFVIDEYLAQKKIKLNIPPFLGGKGRLSAEEEEETRRIASVRIHVERVIERIKNYRILNFVFPNSMANELNKIWVICCHLVNLTVDPIVS